MNEAKELAVVHDTAHDPFVQMVERLATNQDIDAEKVDRLLDAQLRVMAQNAKSEFYRAMAEVQEKIPTVAKTSENKHTKSSYAKHEVIALAIKPLYTQAGFSLSFGQDASPLEGHIRIRGTLMHTAGHSESYYVDLPLDDKGIKGEVNKTALHATGSTLSYGRRYLTCMIFDVATGDDNDGNAWPTLSEEQLTDLQAKAEELFGKESKNVLVRMADKIFRVPGPIDIQARHFDTALTWLENKHQADQQQ